MRTFAAAALAAVTALPAAAAETAVQPLPANTRSLANDIAGKATGEQKVWAAEAGRRRPLPGYEALKAEVRSRFATNHRMSALDVDRLAFLALVAGVDDGTTEATRRSRVVHTPTPAPRLVHAKSHAAAADSRENGAEIEMINLQSLVSQRQMAVQLTTQMMGAIDGTSRTIAANVGR